MTLTVPKSAIFGVARLDWDDLRFVLMVDREGGLAAAANALSVNYSTARRRLDDIERKLGVRLFQRLRSGYRLTQQGEAISETAQRVEMEVLSVERQVLGTDRRLAGTVRVSTSELIGLYALPKIVKRFLQKFPDLSIEISISDQLANLQRREADVVVRGSTLPPPGLVGRNIGPVTYSAYAHRSLVDQRSPVPLLDHDWVVLKNDDRNAPLTRWLNDVVPGARHHVKLDSGAAVCASLAAGLGAAVVPSFVGDALPDVVRIAELHTQTGLDFWVLSHNDLRRNTKVQAFRRFVEEELGSAISAKRS